MEKLQNSRNNERKHVLSYYITLAHLIVKTSLAKLNIPVTEYVPSEIVDLRKRDTYLIFIKRFS